METLLLKVFTALKSSKIIRTQNELADTLEVSKGYLSQLMRQNAELPQKVRDSLNEKFGISKLWLVSGGNEGDMFVDFKVDNNNIHKTNTSESINRELANEVNSPLTQTDDYMTLEWLKRLDKKDEQMDRLIGLLEDKAARERKDNRVGERTENFKRQSSG